MPAQGMKVPAEVDTRGRARLVRGGAYVEQLIQLSLSDCESDNPFQEVGLDMSTIFALPTPVREARIRIGIQRRFEELRLLELARLEERTEAIRFKRPEDGVWEVVVSYVNIEEQRTRELIKWYKER